MKIKYRLRHARRYAKTSNHKSKNIPPQDNASVVSSIIKKNAVTSPG